MRSASEEALGGKVAAVDSEALHGGGPGIVGLDGGDVERGIGVRGHWLGRGYGFGDDPRGLFGGTNEREGKRLAALGPGAGGGIAIGGELTLVAEAENRRGDLKGAGLERGLARVDPLAAGLVDAVKGGLITRVGFGNFEDQAKRLAGLESSLPVAG